MGLRIKGITPKGIAITLEIINPAAVTVEGDGIRHPWGGGQHLVPASRGVDAIQPAGGAIDREGVSGHDGWRGLEQAGQVADFPLRLGVELIRSRSVDFARSPDLVGVGRWGAVELAIQVERQCVKAGSGSGFDHGVAAEGGDVVFGQHRGVAAAQVEPSIRSEGHGRDIAEVRLVGE